MRILRVFFFVVFLGSNSLFIRVLAQTTTVGLIQHSNGSLDDGYVLFAPIPYTTTYLIDKCGKEIHSWQSAYRPAQSVYLLDDGSILRPGSVGNTTFTAGGNGGIIEKIDWNGNVVWSYSVSDSVQCQHHDVKELPNGNVLVISWELKTKEEAIAAGRDTSLLGATLWSEKIVELKPTGSTTADIVWEWHVWDHLIQDFDNAQSNFGTISSHPELINVNYKASNTQSDWLHFNAIDYDPGLDQILISNHNFSEIWIIDHSTTTAQAAAHSGGNSGKGGDLLYRWGNAAAYNNASVSEQKFWGQHDAHWIDSTSPDAGKIIVFNNGHGLPPASNYSSVEIINPPVDTAGMYTNTLPYLPATSFWTYTSPVPTDFFATNLSSAQQLSNGNILICNGPAGEFFELDTAKNQVWEYINPVSNTGPMSQGTTPTKNLVFRCTFYPFAYSGFSGQTLISGAPVEQNPNAYSCNLTTGVTKPVNDYTVTIFPNPVRTMLILKIADPLQDILSPVQLCTMQGQLLQTFTVNGNGCEINMESYPAGMYFLRWNSGGKVVTEKVIKR